MKHGRLVAASVFGAGFVVAMQLVLLVSGLLLRSLDQLTVIGVTAISGAGLYGLGYWVGPRTQRPQASKSDAQNRWIAVSAGLLGGLVALQYAWRAYLAVRFPILDWDGAMYHMVKAAVWIQEGAIVNVPQTGFLQGFPASGEVNLLWFMVFLGNDTLADLAGLLYVPVLIAGTALTARLVGADRWMALMGGLLVAAVPAVFVLGSTTYVDVPSAATAMAAIGLVVFAFQESKDFWQRQEPLPRTLWVGWLLAGGLAGVSAGTKIPNLLVVAIPLVVVAIAGFSLARSSGAAKWPPVLAAMGYGAAAAALGSVWYVINIVIHRNPVYPLRVGPFEGPLQRADTLSVNTSPGFGDVGVVQQVLWSWTADFARQVWNYDVRPGGFGFAWPLLIVPSLVLAAVWLVRRRQYIVLSLVWLPCLAATLVIPALWWARLTILLIALGGVSFALVASNAEMRRGRSRDSLAVPLSVAALVLAAYSMFLATERANFVNGQFSYVPGEALRVGEVLSLSLESRDELAYAVGPWRTCSGFRAIPAGASVALGTSRAAFRWPYLIIGPDLDRFVAPHPLGWPRTTAELEATVDALKVDFIVVEESGPSAAIAQASTILLRVRSDVCSDLVEPLAIYAVSGQ